ncbi:MAG TPA: 9-O-acetylesterase [Phycisphaerales bacterium]|nr:9-O-acetylesterase [Phycisphaerales bacterium]
MRNAVVCVALASCVLVLPGLATAADEALRLPAVLGDNMVLQSGRDVPVWGWAAPGAKVAVKLESASAEATADKDGRWMTKLPALKAGGPFEMTVTAGTESLTVKNILVGEVWICSGQSNMQWSVNRSNNAKEEIAAADYPKIRLFTVRNTATEQPQDDCQGKWVECSPTTVPGFSAVGYFFGRDLHKQLNVPVGLINTSWGGTPAQSWTSLEKLKANELLKPYVDQYEKAVAKPKIATMEEYEKARAEWEAKVYQTDPGNKGLEQGFAAPGHDVSDWKEMKLPSAWESAGMNIDGAVWFRKEVSVPEAWAEKDLTLDLGAIDDFDTTYFNGEQVGATGSETPDAWNVRRKYTVPGKRVRAGANVIAVRIFDRYSGGGITRGPMTLSPVEGKDAKPIDLTGEWKCKVELALKPLPRPPAPFKPGQQNPHLSSSLYNGMIHPLIPFALRGAIWYQGESNAGQAWLYRTLFPAMIEDWRAQWKQGDFPFLWVQLANYTAAKDQPGESNWAELREAQSMTLRLPNTGQAVIIDIGEAKDIHPRNKQDVGARLAMAARKIAYGENLVYSGPVYKSMKVEGDKVILTFDHVSSGLEARGAEGLKGFAIAGEDRNFVWGEAKIVGDTVVVRSEQVSAPVAVRYAWANNPPCTLYNKEGLPASPFRTDDWPGMTQPK